ncbi:MULTISPECIES: cobaltochelatase subunit CobN [Pseudonocardia]|uniref:Aerobic cobaltochelatase subunit CobN n=2 Tax=Pseudonocardia TaxID=1847 RepID=A0A1Y2N7M5_PSEAH|nr:MULTISPECIES: cobaltochelatase subunit CobN [Pseudonocardia]OSY42908.1 Aerobic cobaltochelatase subunit CobN [Pseudonocardia autotrophica]TDN77485.1 cobaltochelatase CobN subunit [Pseudonocardia autotrophica]BBG01508.1 putative cobalamin biosynthesis protein CobN [Pseudonocardia autotrophica]GEC25292.1 putative cobalamin biosynthesis protein CobN [Pseudonocardia saturnea]
MILLLSTSDTDLLSARAGEADYRLANPNRVLLDELGAMADEADVVVVRVLGGYRYFEEGLDLLRTRSTPLVCLGGEMAPDAEMMELSTVPAGVAAEAHSYLAQGGTENLRQLHAFLSDTVLLTGEGFEPPVELPEWGVLERPAAGTETGTDTGPTVAVLFYRAQFLAGNTAYIEALCDAIAAKGATPLPIWCASLRQAPAALLDTLRGADAMVVTVLAAGGTKPASAQAGGEDEEWDVTELAALDVPILQGLCLTSSRETWESNDDGLSPLDVATQVAVPEFDGRLITVPFSFKETDGDGLSVYVPDHERAARVAGIAVNHANLGRIPNAEKKIVLMLSAYPTKHARIGNAVGLDTPASTVALLRTMAEAGYRIADPGTPGFPGVESGDGDALMHALIEAGGQDPDWLTEEKLAGNPIRISGEVYRRWFETLPQDFREGVEEHWGEAPGTLYTDSGDVVVAALRSGNVTLIVQPPRGFGENPVAIYHDPDLPPSHHYLAAYRWLAAPETDGGFGAHAIVHIGKHGNLEWLPGKTLGMSASCGTDAVLGDLPLIYPFLVNDPGEGTQAKRRAHATLIDHLIPPMARAESYGDIARLEQLLDEHANISALDPAKLPAIRQQIWTLMTAAQMHHDLGLEQRPDEDVFDDMLMNVDGWLCEIKDVQIRDGLHVLALAPAGEQRIDLVLAMLRARQMWGGEQSVPGLRQALGLVEDGSETNARTDTVEGVARALVAGMEAADWSADAAPGVVAEHLGSPEPADRDTGSDQRPARGAAAGGPEGLAALPGADPAAIESVLRFAADEVVPRLDATAQELDRVLHALDGGFIPAGPSGSPLRGLINVLPTGRNFYSVDPKAVPSKLAWETGQAMAESLVERYRADHGEYPRSVGLSVWGTSAMRTSGDDVAEVFALLGVRPVWDDASRRVRDLEVIGLEELGRPRVDVTVRISGFFRDAFPHVLALLDDAVKLVAELDETAEQNFVRAHVLADAERHGDGRRARTRIFGSKPGTYGAGLLQLVDSRDWRGDADLAEVYSTWGGYAYGRGLDGVPARDDMENAYRRIAVAAKNIDTREHDIADSDDYYQYHGGMVATVRALTGKAPEAYVGDSTRPEAVRTRTLHEESARVFRARVVNPRWISAMRRHGYKGAFEMAATVDYLFGWDATTGVIADWQYETLTAEYVLDPDNRKFLTESNPWALHGMAERLLEAVDRGLWESPEPATLEALRQAYLESEGDLEGE